MLRRLMPVALMATTVAAVLMAAGAVWLAATNRS